MTVALVSLTVGCKIQSTQAGSKAIASWPAKRGGYFCKVFYSYDRERMEAIADEHYIGHGYIVFLKRKPLEDEEICIISTSKNCATAQIVKMETPNLYVGLNIFSNSKEQRFAYWPADNKKGGYYCKILYSPITKKWEIISNPYQHARSGMVVFIDTLPLEDSDYIQINHIGKKYAKADVYGY